MKPGWQWVALGLGLLPLACKTLGGHAEGRSALSPAAPGVEHLLFDDFHSLNSDTLKTNAAPWKLAGAALVAYRNAQGDHWPETEDGFQDLLLHRYGFLRPKELTNWPGHEAPPVFTKPLGLVSATVARDLPTVRIEAVNQGCATCHAAHLYDAQGNPQLDRVWVGLPSSDIALERYSVELYAAFLAVLGHEDEAMARVDRMFPQVSADERATLRKYVLPELKATLTRLEKGMKRFVPYFAGEAGLTNGVAAMKLSNHLITGDHFLADETTVSSIPDFGGLHLKRSVLIDGVYASPGWPRYGPLIDADTPEEHDDRIARIITLFTVGTLGVDPEVAPDNVAAVKAALEFPERGYVPPPYPGPIDRSLALTGRAVFHARCSGCHGTYSEGTEQVRLLTYPNRLVPLAAIGTDPVRSDRTHGGYQEKFQRGPMGKLVAAAETSGYVPPALTSLWATAPYLHNGSVPTLWHLLHPESRPATFQVGGAKLDLEKVGLGYPEGYVPWMAPDVYDTSKPGHSNAGHDKQVDGLSEPEKSALLEYLKLL